MNNLTTQEIETLTKNIPYSNNLDLVMKVVKYMEERYLIVIQEYRSSLEYKDRKILNLEKTLQSYHKELNITKT